MVKGLYTAYTGMINEQHRMDVLTNNLANANTNGYKKEGATAQSFSDQLALKIKDYTDAPFTARGLGIINPGVKIGEGYVDWTEGPMKETGNTFDMAIGGYGFFGIEYSIKLPEETEEAGEGGTITETYMERYLRLQRQNRELAAYKAGKLSLDEMLDDGFQQQVMYTRDGNFTLNADGVLVTQDGDYVLSSEGGHITLDPNLPVQISMTGEIMQDGEVVANIGVFDFDHIAVSSVTMGYLRGLEDDNRLVSVSDEIPKSLVLAVNSGMEIGYLSPLAARTIQNRQGFGF